jgi:hypothetical protein
MERRDPSREERVSLVCVCVCINSKKKKKSREWKNCVWQQLWYANEPSSSSSPLLNLFFPKRIIFVSFDFSFLFKWCRVLGNFFLWDLLREKKKKEHCVCINWTVQQLNNFVTELTQSRLCSYINFLFMFSFTNEIQRKGEKIPFHPFGRSSIFVSEYYARPASSSNCFKNLS